MVEKSQWVKITEENPDHSAWYIKRFADMASAGKDLGGEARLINAMLSRGSRVLDAGCGPGRVASMLSVLGHDVVGVDVDPVLIDEAKKDESGPKWFVADLAELDLPAHGVSEGFDAILCAGNVMTFLAPSTRREVLRRMGLHLRNGGRAVIGFGAGRGYEFDEFFADAEASGLESELKLGTWDLHPLTSASDFVVAVFGRS